MRGSSHTDLSAPWAILCPRADFPNCPPPLEFAPHPCPDTLCYPVPATHTCHPGQSSGDQLPCRVSPSLGIKGHCIFLDGPPPHPTPGSSCHTHWQMTSGPCTAGPAVPLSTLPSPERDAASTMGSWEDRRPVTPSPSHARTG